MFINFVHLLQNREGGRIKTKSRKKILHLKKIIKVVKRNKTHASCRLVFFSFFFVTLAIHHVHQLNKIERKLKNERRYNGKQEF